MSSICMLKFVFWSSLVTITKTHTPLDTWLRNTTCYYLHPSQYCHEVILFRRKIHTLKERTTRHDIIVGVRGSESPNSSITASGNVFFKVSETATSPPKDKNYARVSEKEKTCEQGVYFCFHLLCTQVCRIKCRFLLLTIK